jgi:hypothetical protein
VKFSSGNASFSDCLTYSLTENVAVLLVLPELALFVLKLDEMWSVEVGKLNVLKYHIGISHRFFLQGP